MWSCTSFCPYLVWPVGSVLIILHSHTHEIVHTPLSAPPRLIVIYFTSPQHELTTQLSGLSTQHAADVCTRRVDTR